jgi:hypothetical protein
MLELAMTEGMLFVVVILLLCVDNGIAHIALTLYVNVPVTLTFPGLQDHFWGTVRGTCVCMCVHVCV